MNTKIELVEGCEGGYGLLMEHHIIAGNPRGSAVKIIRGFHVDNTQLDSAILTYRDRRRKNESQ